MRSKVPSLAKTAQVRSEGLFDSRTMWLTDHDGLKQIDEDVGTCSESCAIGTYESMS